MQHCVVSFSCIMPHILIVCAYAFFSQNYCHTLCIGWNEVPVLYFLLSFPLHVWVPAQFTILPSKPSIKYTNYSCLHELFHSNSLIIFMASYEKNIIIPFLQMREPRQERNVASLGPQSRSVAGSELLALSLFLFLPKRRGVAIFTCTSSHEGYSKRQDQNTAMGALN